MRAQPEGMRLPWLTDPDLPDFMSEAEMEAAAEAAAAYMAKLREEEKAFDPNQPRDYHGRWTSSGSGSPDWAERYRETRLAPPFDEMLAPPIDVIEKDKSVNELKDFLGECAEKRGFDTARINVIDERDAPVFKVGDKLYTQDGVFHRDTGQIDITHHMGWTEDFMGPVISHEITHAKYVAIAQAIQRGDRAIGSFSKFKPKDLRLADGVTDYSGQYWKVQGQKVAHPFDLKTDRPINETLADVAAIRDARNRKTPSERYVDRLVPPIWNDFFDEIESQYAKGKESGWAKRFDPNQPRDEHGRRMHGGATLCRGHTH